jgi:hypothetical protein
MIHIDFDEPQSQAWKDWRLQCNAKREKLEEEGRPEKISDLYKQRDIKDTVYFAKQAPFYGKCAYCEAYITDFETGGGDIEHFRPKLAVTDENDEPIEHDGYYWLAYYWKNLLPSCQLCNRPNNGTLGKRNRFPVAGTRAKTHTDPITAEDPLLLNPLEDRPDEHLKLDPNKCVLVPLTPKGDMTIKILGLNVRDQLLTLRRQAIDRVNAIWARLPFDTEAATRELEIVLKGAEPCTAASRFRFDQLSGAATGARKP